MNRRPSASAEEAGGVLESGLSYAVLADGVVHHRVTIASLPEFIGTTLERFATLDGATPTLETPAESYGRARLAWRRVTKGSRSVVRPEGDRLPAPHGGHIR